MRYDLDLVKVICSEQGFPFDEGNDIVEISLGEDSVLCVKNDERDEDCLLGFEGTPWHTHSNLNFVDSRGHYIEMTYLEVLAGLGNGTVLICALMQLGAVKDRWLIHRDYNSEFVHMQVGEKIDVFRAAKVGA